MESDQYRTRHSGPPDLRGRAAVKTLVAYIRLLGIGRAATRGPAGRGLRFTSILGATFAFALAAAVLTAGFAVYDGREERGSARAPNYLGAEDTERASLLVLVGYDDTDSVQRSVVYVEPRSDEVAPPPGVARWPAPGEVVLSRALRADLIREGSLDRYGKPVGTIAAEGLEVPGERLVYVRPSPGFVDRSKMTAASGFGSDVRSVFGDGATLPPLSAFASLAAGTLLLPTAILVVSAARAGGSGSARRVALLRTFGAGAGARALVRAGEAAVPAAVGTAAAAVVVAAALPVDATIPVVDFVLPSVDLRAWSPALFGSVLGAGLVALLAVALLRPAEGRKKRPGSSAGGRSTSRPVGWLCPVFLLMATRGPDLSAGGRGNDSLWFLVYTLGVLGTLVTLPALIAVCVSALGRVLVREGDRRGRPGALAAGRWMVAQPGSMTRWVATVVIAIGLVSQIQLHVSRLADPMIAAKTTNGRIGDSVLTVSSGADRAQNRKFLRDLPEGAHGLALAVGDGERELRLYGDCAALRALDAPCGTSSTADPAEPRFQELAAWYGGGERGVTLYEGEPSERLAQDAETLLITRGDGGDLPVAEVKEAAFRHLPTPQLMPVAGEWLFGAADLRKSTDWAFLLGVVGVGVLAFAAAMKNLDGFSRFSRRAAPPSATADRPGDFSAGGLWAVLVPLSAAGVAGALISAWLATPMAAKGAVLTDAFLASLLLTAPAAAAFSWWVSRPARSPRPPAGALRRIDPTPPPRSHPPLLPLPHGGSPPVEAAERRTRADDGV